MGKKKTRDEIIALAKAIHGEKYSYDKFEHHDMLSKSVITCPVHGDFEQTVAKHIHAKRGCPKCAAEKVGKWNLLDADEYFKRVTEIHEGKYDYSKSVYKGLAYPITIICPIHGEFSERASSHLHGHGCRYCNGGRENKMRCAEDFFKLAHEIHGDKYDYSQSVYVNNRTKLKIICPKHGEFWQSPHHHINGAQGCPRCGDESCSRKRMLSMEEFLRRSHELHGDKYDYSKVELNGYDAPVEIICPTHGSFWQTPDHHARCGCGCPKCNSSRLEREVIKALDEVGVEYVHQWKNPEIMGSMIADIFIPSKNIVIECQGEQHFRPVEHFGGENTFKGRLEKDERKYSLLTENGINVIYYTQEDVPEEFLQKHEYIKEIDKIKSLVQNENRENKAI